MSEGPSKQPGTARLHVCPTCRRSFTFPGGQEPAWFPFCCDRCQWVDLGKWFAGHYRVSEDLRADEGPKRSE